MLTPVREPGVHPEHTGKLLGNWKGTACFRFSAVISGSAPSNTREIWVLFSLTNLQMSCHKPQ